MKSKRLEERMPQIRNFHWYTIYQMATEDPQIRNSVVHSTVKTGVCQHHPLFYFLTFFPPNRHSSVLSLKSGGEKGVIQQTLACTRKYTVMFTFEGLKNFLATQGTNEDQRLNRDKSYTCTSEFTSEFDQSVIRI